MKIEVDEKGWAVVALIANSDAEPSAFAYGRRDGGSQACVGGVSANGRRPVAV